MHNVELSLPEILAEMDELGRAKFDAAQVMAANKKLVTRIADLEQQLQDSGDADGAAS